MVLLRNDDLLKLENIPQGTGVELTTAADSAQPSGETAQPKRGDIIGPLPEDLLPLWEVEREVIRRALVKFNGNKSRTARYLDVPRHVLLYRIEKFDLR